MKQTVKATALLMLVSLLSSCSTTENSAEDKACAAAQESHQRFENEIKKAYEADYEIYKNNPYFDDGDEIKARQDYDALHELFYDNLGLYLNEKAAKLNSQKVIVNNQMCFSPEQVIEAQNYVEKYN
jgi:CMP-N-acetylneuraminic acid synthetase